MARWRRQALEILTVAAWLAPEGVPAEVLSDPGGRWTRRLLAGMLDPGPDGTLSISPDLQARIRKRYGPAGRDEAVMGMYTYLGEPDPAQTGRCFRLLPHLLAWVELTRPEDDFRLALYLLADCTALLLKADSGALARPLIERVVRSVDRLFAPESQLRLLWRHQLASTLAQAGLTHRAIRVREQAIETAAQVLDPDDPALSFVSTSLGKDLMTIGALDRAFDVITRVAERHRRVLGPAHPDTLMAVFHLGEIQMKGGRTTEAVARWQEVLADAGRELGPDHPVATLARRALARHDGLEVVDDEPTGPLTPATIAAWTGHAARLHVAGDPAAARDALLPIVEEGTALLGPGHPEVIQARWQLALGQRDAGDPATALATLRAALADADRVLGRLHQQTVQTAVFLISTLLKRNCQQEYEALLEDRLADLIDVLGFDDPAVRELAIRRSALRLGGPAWWRTTDDTDA